VCGVVLATEWSPGQWWGLFHSLVSVHGYPHLACPDDTWTEAAAAALLLAAAWVLLFCLCAWGGGVHIKLLWGWINCERDSHTAASLDDAERVIAAAAAGAACDVVAVLVALDQGRRGSSGVRLP
jgi:hypothetical protein